MLLDVHASGRLLPSVKTFSVSRVKVILKGQRIAHTRLYRNMHTNNNNYESRTMTGINGGPTAKRPVSDADGIRRSVTTSTLTDGDHLTLTSPTDRQISLRLS